MTEVLLTDSQALAKAAVADSESGVTPYANGIGATGSDYYADEIREIWQGVLLTRPIQDLRAFVDSGDAALEISVKAGRWLNGDTTVTKAEANAQTLTNNATNYIYYTASGTLTINQSGFPVPSTTPHIPIAEVVTSAGARTSITDRRNLALFTPRGQVDELTFSGTDDTDGTGTMDIQVKAGGASLSERTLIRTWIADADFSEPDPQTDYSVTVGEQLRELEANADYEVISTAAGLITMNIDAGGAKTVYIMAEINGRIYSTSLAITV